MKNKIGYSVPIGFLSDKISKLEDSLYKRCFKVPQDLLKYLKECGVNSIEIKNIKEDTSDKIALKAIYTILKEDLNVTIHGHLPNIISHRKQGTTLLELIKKLHKISKEIVITCHPIKSESGELDFVSNQSKEAVTYILSEFNQSNNVKIALEINRAIGFVDPSYTYKDLLNLLNNINSNKVGLCWDIGHSYWNVLYNSLSKDIPRKFVEGVIHTHIHDLSLKHETHWPLTENRIPLEDYLRLLKNSKYNGIYNIELGLKRWYNEIPILDGITNSIKILKRKLEEFESELSYYK